MRPSVRRGPRRLRVHCGETGLALEGRFRILFSAQSCRTEGDCRIRDETLTHSNAFTVRIGR